MTASELMQALSEAGAPLEAIIIAVRALDEKDAEIKAQNEAAAAKRAADAARKRAERAASKDSPRTGKGQSKDSPADPSPNDIYSNPQPVNPDGAKAPCPPFAEKVVEAWNEGPAKRGAIAARALDAGRRKALSLRRQEHGDQAVLDAIANLARSDFHCGKNDRGWKANIGWLLKSPENFLKLLELAPPQPAEVKPVDPAAKAASHEQLAEFYASIGQSSAAEDHRRQAHRLRTPMQIGQLVQQHTRQH